MRVQMCVCVFQRAKEDKEEQSLRTAPWVEHAMLKQENKKQEKLFLESSRSRVNLLSSVKPKALLHSFVFTWHPIALQRALWKKDVINVRY